MPDISTYESQKAILLDLLPWMHKHNPSLFMHPRKDFPVYASREGLCLCIQGRGSSRKGLLVEYMRRFHENINRVWVKTSKYGGKITQIFKRVYLFNRDFRVHHEFYTHTGKFGIDYIQIFKNLAGKSTLTVCFVTVYTYKSSTVCRFSKWAIL